MTETERKTEPILVHACPECKSVRVEMQVWANPNTGAIGVDTERYSWCNHCDESGDAGEIGYTEMLYIDIDECRDEPERDELRKFLLAKAGRSD